MRKDQKDRKKNEKNKSKAALIITLAYSYKQMWASHFNRNDKLQVEIHAYQGGGYKAERKWKQKWKRAINSELLSIKAC